MDAGASELGGKPATLDMSEGADERNAICDKESMRGNLESLLGVMLAVVDGRAALF